MGLETSDTAVVPVMESEGAISCVDETGSELVMHELLAKQL